MMDWTQINWSLLLPLVVLQLALMAAALIALARAQETNGPKWMWALIIIFVNILGPVIFFVWGRRNE